MKLQRGKPDKIIHEADRIVRKISSELTTFSPDMFGRFVLSGSINDQDSNPSMGYPA